MSPFMRGFFNGWNTVFGGVDQYFGDMIGFMTALFAVLGGVLLTIFIVTEVFTRRDKIISPIKMWWTNR